VVSPARACGPRAVRSKANEQTSTIVLRLCIIFRSVESITAAFLFGRGMRRPQTLWLSDKHACLPDGSSYTLNGAT
jgi:hypothetical protein